METFITFTFVDHAAYDAGVDRLLSYDRNPESAPPEAEVEALADALDAYAEAHGLHIPPPATVGGLLEVEMFSRNLNQRELAQLLRIPETRLSEVLRGKRGVNLDLAQRLHYLLDIPAEVVLRLQKNEDIPVTTTPLVTTSVPIISPSRINAH